MNPADWGILPLYLALLAVLATFGLHRLRISRLYLASADRAPARLSPEARPFVTVQLPVFNERNVVERLMEAACRLEWPRDRLEVQVLDDSTDDTTEVAAVVAARWREAGVDVRVLHRDDRRGYKAGALAAGLREAKGELVAVFDADFVPDPDFLSRVVPYFDLEAPVVPGRHQGRVGMVQARWGYLNEEQNALTRLASVLLDGHFVLEHTARNRGGLFFNFNGTAGVWRKATIEDAGGWTHDTVTEDLDLSYRAQLRGWRFVYLLDVVVPSELPSGMRAYKNQQHRWAKGSIQTARKLLPELLRGPLPRRVKAEAVAHLTMNLAYPLVLVVALLLPWTLPARELAGLRAFWALDLALFGSTLLSIVGFYGLALREAYPDWRRRMARLPATMALGVGMAVSQTRGVVEGLLARDATFVRTPKGGEVGGRSPAPVRRYTPAFHWTALVELTLAAYYGAAIAFALARGHLASVPWLCLFFAGFAFVGLSSLTPARGLSRRAAGPEPEIVLERTAS